MKRDLARVSKRLVAGMFVALAVVAVSAFTMRAPSQEVVGPSLNSIQTDQATTFYADRTPHANWFVEQVLAGTSESKEATENLKVIAAAL